MRPVVLAVVAAGLFAEQSTDVDGVKVRRIRDTSNGVVCYVASSRNLRDNWGTTIGVGISCLPEPTKEPRK